MWFQKVSIPPPWRELEIPKGIGNSKGEGEGEGRGRGGQRPRKFQREGGLYDRDIFQRDSSGPLIQHGFEC